MLIFSETHVILASVVLSQYARDLASQSRRMTDDGDKRLFMTIAKLPIFVYDHCFHIHRFNPALELCNMVQHSAKKTVTASSKSNVPCRYVIIFHTYFLSCPYGTGTGSRSDSGKVYFQTVFVEFLL